MNRNHTISKAAFIRCGIAAFDMLTDAGRSDFVDILARIRSHGDVRRAFKSTASIAPIMLDRDSLRNALVTCFAGVTNRMYYGPDIAVETRFYDALLSCFVVHLTSRQRAQLTARDSVTAC